MTNNELTNNEQWPQRRTPVAHRPGGDSSLTLFSHTLNQISGRKDKVGLESRAYPTNVCVCAYNCKWFRAAIRIKGRLLHSLDDRGHEARDLEQKGPRVGLGPAPAHRECHFSHT
jgi:hypothetical protein